MILADKIIDLRKKQGWSQEELAEKLDVSRQTISKWESAGSVPDMKRVIDLANLFGVSTDYLLRDEMGPDDLRSGNMGKDSGSDNLTGSSMTGADATDTLALRRVSMEDANGFLEFRNKSARRVSIAVFLCIICVVFPILFSKGFGFEEADLTTFYMTLDGVSAAVGLILMFVCVAAAVAIFVRNSIESKSYAFYESEGIDAAYDVGGMTKERREHYKDTHIRMQVTGILAIVLAVIPICVAAALSDSGHGGRLLYAGSVSLTIALVAFGVLCLIKDNMIWTSYDILLEEGNYTRALKQENYRNRNIANIYWTAMTAIYLGWSFVTMDWALTWIIWPVAGILWGVVSAVLRVVHHKG